MRLRSLLWCHFVYLAFGDFTANEAGNTTTAFGQQRASNFTDDPPEGFSTAIDFKQRGQILGRYDAWLAVVNCLAQEAVKGWNDPEIFVDCPSRVVRIKVIRDRQAVDPPLLVQHVIWSLFIVASKFWEEREPPHYAETIFQPRMNAQTLGAGQNFRRAELVPLRTGDRGLGGLDLQNLKTNAPPGVDKVKIDYDPDLTAPPLCTPIAFYLLLMKAITRLAPMNKEELTPGFKFYDRKNDMTFNLGRKDEADDLRQYQIVAILNLLADLMYNQPVNDRFRPFYGKVRWNGVIVAYLGFDKGQATALAGAVDSGEGASNSSVVLSLPTVTSNQGATS
ncbi:uncharacterized protein KY384_008073 [Bacidia gigantensis]|uniref:uncharacterized protein n=1 Tax=Bacidia gigantensis TaxID=2732470 RepID=UPI001D055C4B|nr:uncharacterized protein KY384_008073 [Bacidia gigantensis]KAG8526644.1 hypothetical protein KY384_008073 [Bacidia gigantensis]